MKSIIAISLLVVMLCVSGLASAEINQPCPCQLSKVSCSNCQITTDTTSHPHRVFAGPKVGWINIPAEETTPLCQGCR